MNDVHYGSHAITIEHELVQVLDRSELHIILFDQYLVVDTMKRLSTDTSPIILPTKSCKPFRLAVVQMVDQFTRVLLGSAQLDPGISFCPDKVEYFSSQIRGSHFCISSFRTLILFHVKVTIFSFGHFY